MTTTNLFNSLNGKRPGSRRSPAAAQDVREDTPPLFAEHVGSLSGNMIVRKQAAAAAVVTAARFHSASTSFSLLPRSRTLSGLHLPDRHEFGISRRNVHSSSTSCRMSSDANILPARGEENSTLTQSPSPSIDSSSENGLELADPPPRFRSDIPNGDRSFDSDDKSADGKGRIGGSLLPDETPPQSILLLNLVAVIWGSQHAIIKTVVGDSDVADFTFLRFALASLCALPFLPGLSVPTMAKSGENYTLSTPTSLAQEAELRKSWRWGAELGLWMFMGFSLQAIGLLTTSAQRSGFLLYLNVKLVPFFAFLLLGRNISSLTWISAFTAFAGTTLLALDGQSIGINVGDLWSVLAAAASAMFILRLEKASKEVPNSAELNATSLFVVALLSGIWSVGQHGVPSIDSIAALASDLREIASVHPLEILYLGAISTALSNFIQAKAQRYVPAERASVIYSLDPVYGALFSWIILGETLGGMQAYLGAAMVTVAAATNSLLEFSKEERKE